MYCKERWEFSRMRASQLISSACVIENVNRGLQIPTNERQARPLTKLPTPELQQERKAIYEELHPETKAGGDRKSEEAKSKRNDFALIPTFADDTAQKTNVSPRIFTNPTAKHLTNMPI